MFCAFYSNYKLGHSFAAMKWLMNEHEPDLYDARMRDWYIKAAASPKEIVILLDSSGKLVCFVSSDVNDTSNRE